MRAVGDTMIISPPLAMITEEQVDELVKLARLSLDLTAVRCGNRQPGRLVYAYNLFRRQGLCLFKRE